MPRIHLTPRTAAQREHVIEERQRAIETGEYAEKVGLHEALHLPPPIGPWFQHGESMQEIRSRAAIAGIFVPGQSGRQMEIARLKNLERHKGIEVYGMPIKDRFGMSGALNGRSAWEIPDLVEYDFAYLNFAGAVNYFGAVLGVMPGTNAPLIGSPDDIGPTLGAATATRVAASGQQQYFLMLSCWVFSRTNAGAVYVAAAGTTLQPFICSSGASGAAQINTALSAAALSIPGLTQFWTQIALVAPADRAYAKGSPTDPVAGVVAGSYGDFLLANLITTGALNIQGNTLVINFELL